jgi:hypothetical protein
MAGTKWMIYFDKAGSSSKETDLERAKKEDAKYR